MKEMGSFEFLRFPLFIEAIERDQIFLFFSLSLLSGQVDHSVDNNLYKNKIY